MANFPNGFGNTVIALQDSNRNNLFEGSAVYKVGNGNQYLLLQEAIGTGGRRWYQSFTSNRIDGQWTPLAATKSNPFSCRTGWACSRKRTRPADAAGCFRSDRGGRAPASGG
jgi:hypothetical protein